MTGRVGADSALVAWGVRGHDRRRLRRRLPRSAASTAEALAAFGLTVLYGFAFVWLFIAMGLFAGSPQAAQGLSFLVFPLTLRVVGLRAGLDHAGLDAGLRQPPTHDADVQHGPAR